MPIASSPSKQRGGPAVTHAITAPKGTSAGADGSASSSNAGSSSSVFAPGGLMAGQAAAASTAAATTSTNSEMTALASFKKDLEDEARIEGRLIVYEVSIMYDQLRRVEASISGPWCFLGQQDEAQWMEEEHWRCIPPTVVSFMTHKVPTEEVKFSSAFESANLYFVEKTADHVFRCELQFDPVAELVGPPTRRSLSSSASSTGEDFGPGPVAQWFYFAVYGGRNCAGRNVRYEVPNLSRLKAAQLLATHQKGPLFWSSHHPTWYGNRTKNVTVSNTDPEIAKDVLSRQGFEFRPDVSELATLSFEYTFTHDNETIFFAYGLPYTHTHLRRFLKWSCAFATLDADSTYGGGGGSGKADKDAVSITREELCLSRGRFPVDIVRITRGRDFQHPDDEDDSFVSSDSSEDEAEPAASVYLPSIAENGAGRSGGAESTAGGAASATTRKFVEWFNSTST
ncbi:unnamed protein product [Amoebophrya sp. A25]|nr:unnamed protein product [Amoebophrya sp. A25]|eukprot:GSA25T00000310001.1